MRKTLYIVLSIVGIIGLLALGYYLRSDRTTSEPTDQGNGEGLPITNVSFDPQSPSTSTAAGATASTLLKVLDTPAQAYTITPSSSVIFIAEDGRVNRSDNGNITVLSESDLPRLFAARFSKDGNYLAVGYNGYESPVWSVLDIAHTKWVPLGAGIFDAVWSPVDNRLVTATRDGLSITDYGTAKPKTQTLLKISLADIALSWPAPQSLLLSDKPSSRTNSSVWTYDLKNKTLRTLGTHQGFYGIWNSDLTRGLAFQADPSERGGNLYQVDGNGNVGRQFSLLTLPSKCIFDRNTASPAASSTSESLICGVPWNSNNFYGQQLPDAYLKKSFFSGDDILKIDPISGDIQTLLENAGPFDIADLLIKNNRLYFRNRLDSKIYSIAL